MSGIRVVIFIDHVLEIDRPSCNFNRPTVFLFPFSFFLASLQEKLGLTARQKLSLHQALTSAQSLFATINSPVVISDPRCRRCRWTPFSPSRLRSHPMCPALAFSKNGNNDSSDTREPSTHASIWSAVLFQQRYLCSS